MILCDSISDLAIAVNIYMYYVDDLRLSGSIHILYSYKMCGYFYSRREKLITNLRRFFCQNKIDFSFLIDDKCYTKKMYSCNNCKTLQNETLQNVKFFDTIICDSISDRAIAVNTYKSFIEI